MDGNFVTDTILLKKRGTSLQLKASIAIQLRELGGVSNNDVDAVNRDISSAMKAARYFIQFAYLGKGKY